MERSPVTANDRPLTPTQQAVAALEVAWPGWQIWYVPRAAGGMIWCARRWDGTGWALNANNPTS